MPRKRRAAKRRPTLPTGLSSISKCELTLWSVAGPLVAGDGSTLSPEGEAVYTIWPSWATWAAFYRGVRDEMFAARPWRQSASVAERLFAVIEAGGDPEIVLDEIESAAADPRGVLRAS